MAREAGGRLVPQLTENELAGLVNAAVQAATKRPEPVAKWTSPKYTPEQRDWCLHYEQWTNFEPLMCDYEAGHGSFVDAARKSVHWYESHTGDMHLRVSSKRIPGSDI